jgi:hypothetical protein
MLVVELLLMIAIKFPQLIIQEHLMVEDQVAIYQTPTMMVLAVLLELVVVVVEMDGMLILAPMHMAVVVDRVLLWLDTKLQKLQEPEKQLVVLLVSIIIKPFTLSQVVVLL